MKILLVHNFYGSDVPSGQNTMFHSEKRLLEAADSALGSLPDMVQDGVSGALFAAGDPDALAQGVERLWRRQDLLGQMADGAYAAWQQRYTPEADLAALERVYRQAQGTRA